MLVIIGLVAGGVLVGQNLIAAAEVRAQLTQIEKYQAAVNTFRGKYNYLPGDIETMAAAQFGFLPRGSLPGEGDGNGLIEGIWVSFVNNGHAEEAGETLLFWEDLSTARLIDSTLSLGACCSFSGLDTPITQLNQFFPEAKIGHGNFIYVWSAAGRNYFGLSASYDLSPTGVIYGNPIIPVRQAYSIDAKIDDGLPQYGNAQAIYIGATCCQPGWANSTINTGTSPFTTANPGNATSCFDNGGVTGKQTYSLTQNNGNGGNCALSFRFQ